LVNSSSSEGFRDAPPAAHKAQSTITDLASAEVAIIIVCHNGRKFLPDCLGALHASDDGGLRKHVIVVDNASQDSSEQFIRESFPQISLIQSGTNLGFAAANNLGWELVSKQAQKCEFIYLLNQDTVVESGWLRPIVDYLREHNEVGIVQSKLLLHPRVDTINTIGNRSHFLGFGLLGGYGERDQGQYDTLRSIDYASGAAVMIRSIHLHSLGLFEDQMFMYLEDADLSWKVRQAGYDVRMLPASRVFHKYRFNRDFRFYYHLERNRWWLLLVYYRLATLIVVMPAALLMEIGQLAFAAYLGKLADKIRSYAFFLQPRHIRLISGLRTAAQKRRTISDREFTKNYTGTIDTPELQLFLIRWVANPLLGVYWSLVRLFMFW